MKAILHYIHDPLCSRCYGAAPLVRAARVIPGLCVIPHAAGIMPDGRAKTTVAIRDWKIAYLTGQEFGVAYFEGLLRDPAAVFDSMPPTAALVAVRKLVSPAVADAASLDMLARMQAAHYVEGRRVADPAVLRELALELGYDDDAFEHAYAQALGIRTDAHIIEARTLFEQAEGEDIPGFILDTGDSMRLLEHEPFLGAPAAWADKLFQLLEPLAERKAVGGAGFNAYYAGDGLHGGSLQHAA